MDPQLPGPSGLLGSLRGFADGVIGSIQDRFELLSIELHEEKHRLIQLAIWISVIVTLALLAIIFASLALVVVFWETARVPVVVTLAVVYAAGLGAAVLGFRRYLARQTKPFAGTIAELRTDRSCIREDS